MMGLIKLAAAGTAAYGLYRYVWHKRAEDPPAFAKGESSPRNFAQVRNAGPEAMRDKPRRWEKEDEASDESFPASDPPATY